MANAYCGQDGRKKSNAPSQRNTAGRVGKETPEAAFTTDWEKIAIYLKLGGGGGGRELIAGSGFMNGYRINEKKNCQMPGLQQYFQKSGTTTLCTRYLQFQAKSL